MFKQFVISCPITWGCQWLPSRWFAVSLLKVAPRWCCQANIGSRWGQSQLTLASMASFSFYVQSPNVWQGDIPTQTMLVDCLAIKIFADDWMIANELPRRQVCAEGVVKTASGCSFTHQIIQNHRIIKVAIAGSQGGAEHACYSNRLEMVISSTLYFVHFIQLFYTCTGPQGLWMQPFPKVQIWDIIDL